MTHPVRLRRRAQLAEMRAQRDAWQRVAERLALGAPKPSQPDAIAMPAPNNGRAR